MQQTITTLLAVAALALTVLHWIAPSYTEFTRRSPALTYSTKIVEGRDVSIVIRNRGAEAEREVVVELPWTIKEARLSGSPFLKVEKTGGQLVARVPVIHADDIEVLHVRVLEGTAENKQPRIYSKIEKLQQTPRFPISGNRQVFGW